MSRKYEAIDLIKLKTFGSAKGWNDILNECLTNLDINRIAKIRYQIAAGMDDLVKQKLNTEEMCVLYIRWNKSLEDTAKKIIRIKHPLPQDNPMAKADHTLVSIDVKRKRDHELQQFLVRSNY